MGNQIDTREKKTRELGKLPSAKYARAWLAEGHMRTDDPIYE